MSARAAALLLAAIAAPGQAPVTVLHDLDLLPARATRVVGMAQGRIQWDPALHAVDDGLLHALDDRRPEAVAPDAASPENTERSIAAAMAARSNMSPQRTRSAL